MESLIDRLCIKRLSLPHTTTRDTIKTEWNAHPCCKNNQDSFCHIACLFKGSIEKHHILSIGSNCFKNQQNIHIPSVHAEINAIDKIKKNYETKKLQSINLLIIRVNKLGEVKMSKPCQYCIGHLSTFPTKKGYKINKIIYSLDDGTYQTTTLTRLYYTPSSHHITKFFRNKHPSYQSSSN